MMAFAGHATTAVLPVVEDTHAVVSVTAWHRTTRMKLLKLPQPPVDCVRSLFARTEHEFLPMHDALTIALLPAAPGHEPRANGPDGHDPVGLP